MSCPTAVCQSCGRHYSGWGLAQRKSCDCGGNLIFDSIYGVIIGYVKAGSHVIVPRANENEKEAKQ